MSKAEEMVDMAKDMGENKMDRSQRAAEQVMSTDAATAANDLRVQAGSYTGAAAETVKVAVLFWHAAGSIIT
jgi:hypothetical protein